MSKLRLLACCLLASACSAPVDPNAPLTGPERLSEAGLYADFAARRLADELILIKPRYPLWSDGASKRRFLYLPPGEKIDTSDMDAWRFPIGTRMWKEFSRDGQLLETRLLEKRREPDDGGWFQMAYAWQEDESDAIAVPKGVRGARGTDYDIPAQRDCGVCHYKGEKPLIGLGALQLSTGGEDGEPPTMTTLVAKDLLSALPSRVYEVPGDPVQQQALGYLLGNCSYCHDERSAAAAEVKIFMNVLTDHATVEQTAAYRSLVGQPIRHFPDVGLEGLVVPGKPDKSLVHYRMSRRDDAQMPPLATRRVDDAGVATVAAWILNLPQ